MPGPSNPDNVPTLNATEKYRTSTGNPVQADRNSSLGATAGAIFTNPTNPTEVDYGAVGTPINKG